jgi:hypothetical protein
MRARLTAGFFAKHLDTPVATEMANEWFAGAIS